MKQRPHNTETPSELERKLEIDYNSGAKIIEVPSSQLPPGVLGMYDSITHTIYVASDISEHDRQFVYHHESGHAQGLIDECKTDAYASSRVGYNIRPLRKMDRLAA
ncbi:MAG: hypothetical protein IIA87_00585 [Nanoarchaeota archaeon]|nr:hypothetical protein [Nanoarchaeota archaeon]